MKLLAKVQCSKCKLDSVILTKHLEGFNREKIVHEETLCHDGYGWDINTFTPTCMNCNSSEFIEVELIEINEEIK